MKKKYKVLHPVKTDDGIVKTGTVTLDEKHGEELVGIGSLEEIPSAAPPAGEPTDPAERQAAIVEAIGKLDENNNEQWLTNGKPDIKALFAVLGWVITAAERDAAWETFSAGK